MLVSKKLLIRLLELWEYQNSQFVYYKGEQGF